MLKIAKTISQVKKLCEESNGSFGFVPTMGYLHEGHLSLIKKSKKQNDSTIVSIFVNPKQFEKSEDFRTYPRDEKHDIKVLKKAKVDILFLPKAKELYPDNYKTYVDSEALSSVLEGKSRPGHFRGVATIVLKLFNILKPTNAYFGQKDAQQVAIIKKMVTDLNVPIKIIVGETIREPNGVAISSRNVNLDAKQRQEAIVLYQALQLAQKLFKKGEKNPQKIKLAMGKLIQTTGGNIDYISFANNQTLKELTDLEKGVLVSLAVKFGKTRLIDNIIL